MATTSEAVKSDLLDVLVTKGFNPEPLDSNGNEVDPEKSDVFKFNFVKNGKSFGHTFISIIDGVLKLYTNDRLEASPETNTSGSKDYTDTWTGFKSEMSKFAKSHRLEWEIGNAQHTHYDMKKRTNMKQKEQVAEGYYPTGKKSSYSDSIPAVKILIQHTRQIEEGEQRFRNIAKIFVENINGERFLLPTIRPGVAKVYARHIAEGGTPYDDKGKHITSLVEEFTKMAGFVRATRKGQFNESAQRLVNEGLAHYDNLRNTLSGMISNRGYHNYFDSYTPVLNEESEDTNSLNELFVQETLDPRIESVMPILARLSKNITEMNEVKELANWADTLIAETSEEDVSESGIGKAFEGELSEERKLYFVVKKDSNHAVGTWDGEVFKPFDKTKYPSGQMDMVPNDCEINKVDGPVGDKEIAMAKMNIEEAPGAETLAHNQDTEEKNLKAFGLAEGPADEPVEPDMDADDKRWDDVDEGFSETEYHHIVVDGKSKGKYKEMAKAKALLKAMQERFPDKKIEIETKKEFAETKEFAGNFKTGKAGQWRNKGPKANKPAKVGDLVGANESVELDELTRIKKIIGYK